MKTFIRISMVAAAIVTLNSCGLFDKDNNGQASEEKPAVETPVDTAAIKEVPENQTPDTSVKEEVKPDSEKAAPVESKTK